MADFRVRDIPVITFKTPGSNVTIRGANFVDLGQITNFNN